MRARNIDSEAIKPVTAEEIRAPTIYAREIRAVIHPRTGEVLDPDSVAGRFWAESARQKGLEEEAAKAATPIEHFESWLRLVWTGENLNAALFGGPIRFGPQDLDEWLAEDNPHRMSPYGAPGVLEALGLKR